MNKDYHIRFAKKRDLEGIIELCGLHAAYEKSHYDASGKQQQLEIGLFSDQPKLYCLVVENDSQLVGYATYMQQYATWDTTDYIYMDCLFMKESTRGQGIGAKLMKRIQEEAKKLKCDLIQWQTPDFNKDAIRFYKRLGASSKLKERFFLDA